MKLFVAIFLVMCVAAGVSANCGCLKCSSHLQAVDIPGPAGCPVKVIFKRPQCQCKAANKYGSYSPVNGIQKEKYSAKIFAPLPPAAPRTPRRPLLKNLKYKTTAVLVPPPTPPPCNCMKKQQIPEATPEEPEIPAELLQWLLSLSTTPEATAAAAKAASLSSCSSCNARNKRNTCECGENCSCPMCQKKSIIGRSRTKRALGKHSYNFFMNLLPQSFRAPLHDSIRGSNVHNPKKPPSLLSQLSNAKNNFKPQPKVFGRSGNPWLDPKPKSPLYPDYLLKNSLLKQPKLVLPTQSNEATLLKKLKKLNSNPFSSNLEDQATTFMKTLIHPQPPALRRAKRTITIGSDELDLPPHYEVDLISEEEDDGEDEPPAEQLYDSEDPIVGDSPFIRNLRLKRPVLAPLFQKPEIVMRKHEIQSAVREELQSYHRKLEQEQKLKKLKEDVFRKKNVVPQNPIFRILTAPMQFLRHFHDINKGMNPVVTSLPKLVHTTKKYFRDFGKNFHKNCLNLASDIIGDFDHVNPSVIQEISRANERRFRRSAQGPDFRNKDSKPPALEEVDAKIMEPTFDLKGNLEPKLKNMGNKPFEGEITDDTEKLSKSNNLSSKRLAIEPFTTEDFVNKNINPVKGEDNLEALNKGDEQTEALLRHEADEASKLKLKNSDANLDKENPFQQSASNNTIQKELELKKTIESTGVENLTKEDENISKQDIRSTSKIPHKNSFAPEYVLTFASSLPKNFPRAPEDTTRKKRYVVKVVDDSEIQDQVQNYLSQQMNGHLSYLQPLQDYYDKVNEFVTKLYSQGHDYVAQPQQQQEQEEVERNQEKELEEEEEVTEKPKKRRLKIRRVKPKVIIDNKGLPFLEYDGFKRPLFLRSNGKRSKINPPPKESSEESRDQIDSLIARAKEDSEIVGASLTPEYMPQQIIKERISTILEEIDQLVRLNPETFDSIFESLIKVQQIKTSIEQEWKKLIMTERTQDIKSKIGLLSKFRDLQHAKDDSVKHVAEALKQSKKSSFVRKQLVHSMVNLQKLQCLISTVLDDFDQHLKTKTTFNTKKEIKMVDFLSELKFVYAKTRNDLVEKLNKDREAEGHKDIELLHKLKKLLISADDDDEKFQQGAKLVWELKNLEKLQNETIEALISKLRKKLKVKKELKILFDLQKRYEDCVLEINDLLGNHVVKATKMTEKKDVKDVIAEIKKKHEELVQKAKERRENLLKMRYKY